MDLEKLIEKPRRYNEEAALARGFVYIEFPNYGLGSSEYKYFKYIRCVVFKKVPWLTLCFSTMSFVQIHGEINSKLKVE